MQRNAVQIPVLVVGFCIFFIYLFVLLIFSFHRLMNIKDTHIQSHTQTRTLTHTAHAHKLYAPEVSGIRNRKSIERDINLRIMQQKHIKSHCECLHLRVFNSHVNKILYERELFVCDCVCVCVFVFACNGVGVFCVIDICVYVEGIYIFLNAIEYCMRASVLTSACLFILSAYIYVHTHIPHFRTAYSQSCFRIFPMHYFKS